jgi:hypothetical protein
MVGTAHTMYIPCQVKPLWGRLGTAASFLKKCDASPVCRPQTRWLCALSVGMRTDAAGGHIDHATHTYRRTGSPPPPSFIFEHFQPDPKWEKLSQLDFSRVLAFARAAAPVLFFNTSLIRWNGCRSPHHYHHHHHSTANNATDVSYFSLTFLFYRCSLLILSTR